MEAGEGKALNPVLLIFAVWLAKLLRVLPGEVRAYFHVGLEDGGGLDAVGGDVLPVEEEWEEEEEDRKVGF